MKARIGLPLITFLTISSLASGAERSMTWTDLVARTKSSNEDIQATERNLQSSVDSVKGSYYDYFPQISASVSDTRGTDTTDQYGVALTATQNIFAGFNDAGKIAQSKANLDIARATYQTTYAQVSLDLKTAVAGLIYAQNYIKLSQETIERREFNLKMVQLQFDSGRENKGSLLLSKAYLEDSRLDNLQAKQDLAVAQSRLAKVLGDEEKNTYILSGQVPVANPPEDGTLDFEKLVLDTPAYKNAMAQEDLAKATLTQTESNFYPSLNLTASTGQYGANWYPDQNRWSAGLALSIPLFNGARDYFNTRGAIESLKATTLSKSSTLKDQVVKLKDAYNDYVQAVQRLKVNGSYLEAAQVREKVSRQKYNNGLSTFDDWDIIESDLIKRQKDYLTTERDRIIYEATWEQVLGKGVLQ